MSPAGRASGSVTVVHALLSLCGSSAGFVLCGLASDSVVCDGCVHVIPFRWGSAPLLIIYIIWFIAFEMTCQTDYVHDGALDSEPNVRNKLSRGKFTAVFLLQ